MKSIAGIFLSLTLVGCAVSRPFSGPGYDGSMLTGDSGRTVYVAITNAFLDRSRRSAFDEKSQQIYKKLPEYEGYLMGSIRLRLLGKEVWTYSVWESRQSLDDFLNSRQHANAMYMHDQAIESMRSVVLEFKARDVPTNWKAIEAIINKKTLEKYEPL